MVIDMVTKANIKLTEDECETIRLVLVKAGKIRLANNITKQANAVFITKDMIMNEACSEIQSSLCSQDQKISVAISNKGIIEDDISFQHAIENYENDN